MKLREPQEAKRRETREVKRREPRTRKVRLREAQETKRREAQEMERREPRRRRRFRAIPVQAGQQPEKQEQKKMAAEAVEVTAEVTEAAAEP